MFDFNPARFAQLVVNVLAVAGGFLLGHVLTGAAVWWLGKGRAPDGLKRTARLLGGTIVAVLVFLIVFGHGLGWTLFGGGLPGTDNGSGQGPAATAKDEPAATAPDRPPPKPSDTPLPGERVRVTLLGGSDVRDQKFYLLDDDPMPRGLDEVKAAVKRKADAATKGLVVEIRFAARNTLPREHPAVTLLERWAKDAGLTVAFPAE